MAGKIILLQDILKDSDYQQSQFNLVQITEFEKRIIVKTDKNGKNIPYIQCLVRKKEIRLTPEETIKHDLELLKNEQKLRTAIEIAKQRLESKENE